MTTRTSFSAWWLAVAVPTWMIVLNPLVGLVVLLVVALVMAVVD